MLHVYPHYLDSVSSSRVDKVNSMIINLIQQNNLKYFIN